MIIPSGGKDLQAFLKYVLDTCNSSKQDRIAYYARRRRYFLFGSNAGASLHNRLNPHLDLVASFIYSPDHATFSIPPFPLETSDDPSLEQLFALGKYWNDEFKDSDLAYQFAESLIWSLVYDTMFIKMGWNEARKELFGRIVDPAHIGVMNEAIPDLDNQDAFSHTYMIGADEAAQRLARGGLGDKIKNLNVETGPEEEGSIPTILRGTLMPSGPWGPSITDTVIGQVNTSGEQLPSYCATTETPLVKWNEITVWDDRYDDWSMFTFVEPNVVISDSRETMKALTQVTPKTKYASENNIFLPEEHPFIQVQPYSVYDYFWGKAHIENLIPLQIWSDKRIKEIQDLLARQVRPSKMFTGFTGNIDEVSGAVDGPQNWVTELPGADVKELKPEIPPDCFAELKEIGAIFLEQSGLTETIQGRGEQGVRGRGHAKQLAATGSGRIRKVAIGLEKPLAKLGDIGLKLIMRNSEDKLKAGKMSFLPAQVAQSYRVRIAGHSHSPLFHDETKEELLVMMKAGAITPMELIDGFNPPNAAELKYKLGKRMAAKQAERQQEIAQGIKPDQPKKKAA